MFGMDINSKLIFLIRILIFLDTSIVSIFQMIIMDIAIQF